ncbi:hypothetical protein [uncultured Sutterella sp.]|uniref:hypothetical protein n=1 Tax=uncultured Sutterella sp. TaxID=286133 RepID=UPI00280C1181|nr:hypothetical protein [uncultured Sutterella sp.]
MQPIDYFRRQAKNLLQDLQTRKLDPDRGRFVYAPRFFDIDALILSFLIQRSE